MTEDDMNRFLIINPFGIGDVLFTTPVVRAIKQNYPDSFIGYWCNERVRDLLKDDPKINRIFALSRGDIKRIYKRRPVKGFFTLLNLLREIRKEKFNTAFDFSLDSRYGLWSKLAGIRKRIGFNYKGRGRFLTEKIDLIGYSARHVIEYYADLLKFIGIEPKNKVLDLTVSGENRAKAIKKLAGLVGTPSDLVIGIAMGGGASWGRDAIYKQWPAKNFAQLTSRIIKETNANVVLLGDTGEKGLGGIIVNDVKNKNIIDLTGKINLEELAAIIKELKLLVCNDGGPMHMAVALGVKTVSIFGPVDEKVYGPYPSSEKHVVVKKDISCRPCYKNFRFNRCLNNRRCLEEITVNEVYDSVSMSLRGAIATKQSK